MFKIYSIQHIKMGKMTDPVSIEKYKRGEKMLEFCCEIAKHFL